MTQQRELPQVDVVRVGAMHQGFHGVGMRWVIFGLALALSVVPAWLGLTVLPWLMQWSGFFNLAWTWQIIAFAPAGYTRIGSDGVILLADSAWLVSLLAWALAGLVCAWGLQRISLPRFAFLVLPLVLAVGMLMHLLVRALGFIPYLGL